MIRFSFQIAQRFKQPKTEDSYIKFVSSVSTIGVGLGSAVLILLLSVMNGFEYELRNTLLKVVPHGEIFSIGTTGLNPAPNFESRIELDPRVQHVFTINKATGLLQFGKDMKAVSIIGANDAYFEAKFSQFTTFSQTVAQQENLSGKSFVEAFGQVKDGIILGEKLLEVNRIEMGDRLQILLPSNTSDLSFKAPKSAWVTVIGSISVGGELDNQLAIVDQSYLAELLGFENQYTHLEIQLFDPFLANRVIREYGYQFEQAAYISDWTRTKGHLYQDIQLIRMVVYIVLALVISVACFNIVSALVMSVEEKSKEIAILKTIGATSTSIALIFVFKGLYHGLKGALIGTLIGVLLALYLSEIIYALEWVTGSEFISGDIYFTKSIPSKLNWIDVLLTSSMVVVIAVIATLYPARQAAKLAPATNLH